MSMLVFSSHYFPNIAYVSALNTSGNNKLVIDIYENFQKQSYRNRAVILGANGSQNIIVPVLSSSSNSRTIIKNARIDNSQNWKLNHWKTLQTAYRSSPFFEYYEDIFIKEFVERSFDFLHQLNDTVLKMVLKMMDIEVNIEHTNSYISPKIISPSNDYRRLNPKVKVEESFEEYIQVFFGKEIVFFSNLSVLDLLFNQGLNSKAYLLK